GGAVGRPLGARPLVCVWSGTHGRVSCRHRSCPSRTRRLTPVSRISLRRCPGKHVVAFELPCRKAPRMQVVRVQSGRAVTVELDLELHLSRCQQLATYRAGLSASETAQCTVRFSCRQLSADDRLQGLLAQDALVPHLAGVLALSSRSRACHPSVE